MKTLPLTAGEDEIKALVIEWNELLAREDYAGALSMFLHDDTQIVDGQRWVWTPEKLEAAVYTYGMPWFTREDIRRLYDDSADYKVTSLARTPPEEIRVSIDRFEGPVTEAQARMWCITELDYGSVIGDVLFDGVPLNGQPSDLTALFWLVRTGEQEMTLLFRELHVM